jgi:hypothetical protein
MQLLMLITCLTPDVYHLLLAAVNYGGEKGGTTKLRWTKRSRGKPVSYSVKRLKASLGFIYNGWSIPMVAVEREFVDENARPIRLPE